MWLASGVALLGLAPAMAQDIECKGADWPLWGAYASRFVQADGRVLESSVEPDHSTSEGQSYAMLFAVIGNDPERFDKLWQWTSSNLMAGNPGERLPGWLWGRGKDGKWQLAGCQLRIRLGSVDCLLATGSCTPVAAP